ncbi:lipopolysaccharide/colanic/teichoic acid biosynthesis glycosyltransferase [Tepidamorphus gemmatus]|uniref:Lipopolysaccharide/colanic/teichoic acid biosynthesis glycosyltransferase n=1 Tax=Tepidamorphus gemmatus TaxID=747076 RepID=A0A4R3ML69_9HYPH|nr:sugar transferase [Tepidamorphus gemmatus]TCT12620.1 lipopolysaccharide/colanic/teichoic acid biosynthesis glycosyltransferase [Tepidamorphus gemmatus]
MPADLTKRAFDILASAIGLVVLSPVLLAIGLAIRLESGPPVLFRQTRVGRGGALFTIHKFRTMRPAAGSRITAAGDPRVTRVGAFLRRTKLDELPQLWDILRGVMSFVGPRPEVPDMLAYYPPGDRAKLLSVRPGITDLATLEFRDEEAILAGANDVERAYLEEVVPRKLALATRYVDSRSFTLDMQILARTLAALVRRPPDQPRPR